MTRILAAGDQFIRAAHLSEALDRALGSHHTVEITQLEYPWPDTPFGKISEVDEASGTEDETIAALEGASAIMTQLAPLTERVIASSPDLRLIAVSRGGPTNVNLEAARAHGVMVANVPGRNGVATAEMTIGLSLALLRGIPAAHQTLIQNTWRGDLYRHDVVGGEICGSTVGLIGAGAVGAHVARVFAAMGAKVLVFDPYLPEGMLAGVVERVEDVNNIFRRSDLVSMHARLTPDTHHLVNAERLALMPLGSRIINAARGGLVDYNAVADAIESGQLAGAAFDVYPEEPVDFSHRLFKLADAGHQLVLTPHIAGASRETATRAANGVAEEVRRFLAGEPPLNPLISLTTPAVS